MLSLGVVFLVAATTFILILYLNFKNYFGDCAVEDRGARAYLLDALDLMRDFGVNSHKVDWLKVREHACETAKLAKIPTDTYPAIRSAMLSMRDFHSSLTDPGSQKSHMSGSAQGYRLALKVRDWLPSQSVPEPPQAILNSLPYAERYTVEQHGFAMPAHRIGYVRLDGFTSRAPANMLNYADTLASAVDNILLQSACGVIIDLRQNQGGNMFPQFLGLRRLLGDGKVMGMKEANGRETWVSMPDRSYCHVSGSRTACFLRLPASFTEEPDSTKLPIAVLISRQTGSAAEAVALGFVGRPNTKTFGDRTAGGTTANVEIPLRDGAKLALAVSEMTDRNGRTYPMHIEPDEFTTAIPPRRSANNAEELQDDKTAQLAIAWLGSQSNCGSR
jgi:carboxyl-terminal processing protease